MPYLDLQSFLRDLERAGELRRVPVEVDPELEITEIVTRVIREDGPALLFERRGRVYLRIGEDASAVLYEALPGGRWRRVPGRPGPT